MSKTNAFENALLELVFKNTNIANIGDATGLRGSSVAGSRNHERRASRRRRVNLAAATCRISTPSRPLRNQQVAGSSPAIG